MTHLWAKVRDQDDIATSQRRCDRCYVRVDAKDIATAPSCKLPLDPMTLNVFTNNPQPELTLLVTNGRLSDHDVDKIQAIVLERNKAKAELERLQFEQTRYRGTLQCLLDNLASTPTPHEVEVMRIRIEGALQGRTLEGIPCIHYRDDS